MSTVRSEVTRGCDQVTSVTRDEGDHMCGAPGCPGPSVISTRQVAQRANVCQQIKVKYQFIQKEIRGHPERNLS